MGIERSLRNPREIMDGWVHLPRYIDNVRLHLAGLLPPKYAELFGDQSDKHWSETVGITHEQMIDVVHGTITDGQV